jgi:hypothetical protein
MKFNVSGSGPFRVFTAVESGESYRIPIRDILLVLHKQGPPPSDGEQVELNKTQIDTLFALHKKWSDLGDDAAIRHNVTQGTLGCISWILVLAAIVVIIVVLFR